MTMPPFSTTKFNTKWNDSTRDAYWHALEALPPAIMTSGGFLLGEPQDHRTCAVTGKVLARYSAYREYDGEYFTAERPLTIPEFKSAMKWLP